MKKTILSLTMVLGLAGTTFGQSVYFDNTSGGGLVQGAGPSDAISGSLYGGPAGGSLSHVVTLLGPGQLLNLGGGLVFDPTGLPYTIPGVGANQPASLRFEFWLGAYPNYNTAAQALAKVADSGVFTNPTGGGGVPPTLPAGGMANMPNVTLAIVPEPSTVALCSLGLLSLLLFRRRN